MLLHSLDWGETKGVTNNVKQYHIPQTTNMFYCCEDNIESKLTFSLNCLQNV